MVRIGLAREGADDLPHTPRLDQRGGASFTVARVVADDGEVARATGDQGVDQLHRHARCAEAPDHDRGAIPDVGHRLGGAVPNLLDHLATAVSTAVYHIELNTSQSIGGHLHDNRRPFPQFATRFITMTPAHAT